MKHTLYMCVCIIHNIYKLYLNKNNIQEAKVDRTAKGKINPQLQLLISILLSQQVTEQVENPQGHRRLEQCYQLILTQLTFRERSTQEKQNTHSLQGNTTYFLK